MLIDINLFQVSKINVHDPYEVDDNILKVDLSIDKLKPIMLVLNDLQVLSFRDDLIILSLKGNENIKKIIDDLDTYVVSIIQEKKITKKLKTKFNYRPFTSTYTNKDTSYDILSLAVNQSSDVYKTDIYVNANKKLSNEEAINIMKDNARVDIVLEIVGVTFDKKEGFIYLENLVRQMRVKKIKPKRLEKIQYSFVDEDSLTKSIESTESTESTESDKQSRTKQNKRHNKNCDDDCLVDCLVDSSKELDIDLDIELESDTSESASE